MPLDPNIPLQVQSPQIQNPLDAASKAMSMSYFLQNAKRAQLENQMQQIQLGNTLATNQAMAKNTTVNPDGTVSINQQGVMSDLANAGRGNLIPGATAQINQYNLGMASAHNQMKGQILQSIPTGQNVPLPQKQAAWTAAINQAKQNGIPGTQNLPQQYPGDDYVNQVRLSNANESDYLKGQANQIAAQSLGLKAQDLALQRQKFTSQIQQNALDRTMQFLNSGRQTPDVRQAYLDRYNAQKVLDMIGSGDPNKLNPQMVQLLSGEVAKIAQGGVPQSEELKNITPSDAQMILARTSQYISSNPKASNQAAFVNVFRNYAGTIQGNANQVIKSKIGSVIESQKPWLSPTDYSNLNKNYLQGTPNDVFQQTNADGTSGAPGTAPTNNGAPSMQPQAGAAQPQGTYQPPKMGTTYVHGGITYIATPQGWAPQNQSQAAR